MKMRTRRQFLKITLAALLTGCATLGKDSSNFDINNNKIHDDLERRIKEGNYTRYSGSNLVNVKITYWEISERDINEIIEMGGVIGHIYPDIKTIHAGLPATLSVLEQYARRGTVQFIEANYPNNPFLAQIQK
jgi:predicted membrane-bound dolichyl-phosphate-mannose-protein mannosyltransferase